MTNLNAIYISGPVTGIPENNAPAFAAEAARLRAAGHTVVNPLEIDLGPDATWSDYMRADITEMLKCSSIRMLPGWERSRGAVLELSIACHLGFELSLAAAAEAT
jgi:hypothetical protein